MDIRKVKKLIELLEESGLSEIEITEGEDTVRITRRIPKDPKPTEVYTSTDTVRETDSAIEPTKNNHQNNFHKILAPMIGTFFLTPEPGTEAFVKVGDEVSQGDTLCIIEAMKMMNQIESDVDGIVERILVQSGDPVEYDQALFLISQN
jgi:acetyl-CoA carboxylase biotin carboxyl carrier protein